MERTSERWQVLEMFEENKAELRTRINAGIEVNRKGSATITVKDKDGNVIPGARVKAVQKSHEFRFGANLFMLDELETPRKERTLQGGLQGYLQHGNASLLLGCDRA